MANINDANPELIDLMFYGLDQGIEALKDNGAPLVPFLITQTTGKRTVQRFMSERLEEGLAQARQFLSELVEKPDFSILVYDGYVTVEDKKIDAVMVEGDGEYEREIYTIAQRYELTTAISELKAIGNPAYVGAIEKGSIN